MEKGDLCKVVSKHGKHLIKTPNGELLKGIVFTRVHDGLVNEPSFVILKMWVQIEDTEKE